MTMMFLCQCGSRQRRMKLNKLRTWLSCRVHESVSVVWRGPDGLHVLAGNGRDVWAMMKEYLFECRFSRV
jgi:hypothetical protein